ncbi:MAG: Fe-S-containing protein [Desulfobacteria bacterium]
MAVNRRKGMIIGGVAVGIVVVVVAAVSAGVLDGFFKKSPAETAKAAGVVETADAVRIPLKALDSGKALFLSLESEGRQFYYFALKSRDGAYRAALDACDVCYRTNRGYRQEGDLMVCNNCGQTFPSNRIAEIKGGCNPHPLARGIDGRDLVIRKADIFARGDYFARKRS